MLVPAVRKARGAYYTDRTVADFLVRFAVRAGTDTALEPCFGGGVFLEALLEHFLRVGGQPPLHVTGIEVDPGAYRSTSRVVDANGVLGLGSLRRADFFDCDAAAIGRVDAIVGNPPFIRYQTFSGAQRRLALRRALEAGARLSALTSSWAPFLIHATTFLKTGGRLGMVAPAELCHATYARPVLDLLARRFRSVRILTFARRLFPGLSEDTVLVLAEGYGTGGGAIRLVPLPSVSDLARLEPDALDGVPVGSGSNGIVRLILYLLPEATRELYARLAGDPRVARLGALASTGIGYVTGNNDFFHLSVLEAQKRRIPSEVLAPAVCRANWLEGIVFRRADWQEHRAAGKKALLLRLPPRENGIPVSVLNYLRTGERSGIDRAYKCRVRRPWYSVPHVAVPDLFLTYMANKRPGLVVNRARAVAPNTLLCLRLHGLGSHAPESLAAAWWTSLTALSAEIEGHSLGAGMLKLEPKEAARVLLPLPEDFTSGADSRRLTHELDRLVRRDALEEALDLGDAEILQARLGLSREECSQLRESFNFLMERRRRR